MDVSDGHIPQVIFVNRYFYPDHSASSQILSDLAFYLAEQGVGVRVLASRQIYDDPAVVLPASEYVRGVDIVRVRTTHFGRHSMLGRIVDYLSFYVMCGFALLRHARRNDVVVTKTDPPMLSVLSGGLAPLRGFKTVNWLQDLYPEVARELGVVGLKGVFGSVLTGLRNVSLRQAAMNVVIDEDMAKRVKNLGIAKERFAIVHNWTDDDKIIPSDAAANPLRREWNLEGKFVLAYSGNLGRAHDFETVLSAAESLRGRSDIVFLFIGGGRGLTSLSDEVRNRGLTNFRFQPYQPRDNLFQSLAVADAHWLSLKPELRGLIFPSKFYGIAAAGRPIFFVGSPEGELAGFVARHECGVTVPPGSGDELARHIASLAGDRALRMRWGENARRMLDLGLTKSQALKRWGEILRSVLTAGRS